MGSFIVPTVYISTTSSIDPGYNTVYLTGFTSNITVTLPPISNDGQQIILVNIDSGNPYIVTIVGNGTDIINGTNNIPLTLVSPAGYIISTTYII